MVAYALNRAVGLETNEMARVIRAKTSEMNEGFADFRVSFSQTKLGIYHGHPTPTREEFDANTFQMPSSINGCQHQIHLRTITKHALSDKLRLAIGSSRAAITQNGKRARILFSGYTAFPGVAKLFYAQQ